MYQYKLNQYLFFSISFLLLCILIGCAPSIINEGYQLDASKLNKIIVLKDNKKTVYSKLGSPSSITSFSDKTWLYIGKKTEQKAFFSPVILSQKVIKITFDKNDIVTDISQLSLKDGKNIEPLSATTPSLGKKLGLFEQIFGNLGRGPISN
ncbi:outer membrane protein assembly factor BamE [Alphaproteobacteria bacterium]|nr:outer membrane protein assembly factor BamE [Alphaproteobacteria bacterium]